ncbi:adenosine deaminase/editase [Cristinia sonorae]|uniref:tRNA-specific adenosine deaminase 1 n=1 Tax=Cristinia sonorae TaxID=1940300 RepID=A0A8K0UWW0_9AGAR|nr:adenosine deaminase/editase [Cristinia sonorae]
MSNGVVDPDDVARVILALYSRLAFNPPPRQFTILAAFALCEEGTSTIKVISLGTGSKCLPAIRLCKEGDALHDSHAEVIARRGAMRWLMEEVDRACRVHSAGTNAILSPWLQRLSDGKYALRDGVKLILYVSTVPCGDASTRFLASFQDPEMAALKDSSQFPTVAPGVASRGRDNYSLFGVLRTKPGRADSPPTLSMSCSDKIASWNILGIQGALGSKFLYPVYVSDVVIGEVAPDVRETVREDCERAFWGRLERIENLPSVYRLNRPTVCFTSLPFEHSRVSLQTKGALTSCNESLCWTADSTKPQEILINGIKRGISPKNQHNPKFRPLLSKLAFFNLYLSLLSEHAECDKSDENVSRKASTTYYETKQAMSEYQVCKTALLGPEGLFRGWVKTGPQWERFDQDGRV